MKLVERIQGILISAISFILAFIIIIGLSGYALPSTPAGEQDGGIYSAQLKGLLTGATNLASYYALPGTLTVRDADRIDGIDGSALQRKLGSDCSAGTFMTSVQADGTIVCDGVINNSGVCGTVNGTTVASYPNGSLACASGAQVDLDTLATDGNYNWKCDTVGCSANKFVNTCATAPDITLPNGQVWKACNIGATSTNPMEILSYGEYYQWGRNNTGFTLPSKGIAGYDWQDHNDNAWGNTTNTELARQGPCESGYHVPTRNEWAQINSQMLLDMLRLPKAGGKYYAGLPPYTGPVFNNQGTIGFYWSSTPYPGSPGYFDAAYNLDYNGAYSSGAFINANGRAVGFSVRCIKNPVALTYAWKTSSWGACSVACDGGVRYRSAWCERSDGARVSNTYCSGIAPVVSESCNTNSCYACSSSLGGYTYNPPFCSTASQIFFGGCGFDGQTYTQYSNIGYDTPECPGQYAFAYANGVCSCGSQPPNPQDPGTPVNGTCGSANGSGTVTQPMNNLCNSGSPTIVTQSGSTWIWSCNGVTGGTSQNCSSSTSSPPSTPTGLTGTAGNGSVSLSWNASSGSPTDYIIEYKTTASAIWNIFNDGVGVGTTANVTSLTNGTSYDFRVKARNASGDSGYSNTITRTPTAGAFTCVTEPWGSGNACAGSVVLAPAPDNGMGTQITVYNTSPGYTGSALMRCYDGDPVSGNIAQETIVSPISCSPIVATTCSTPCGVLNPGETCNAGAGPGFGSCSSTQSPSDQGSILEYCRPTAGAPIYERCTLACTTAIGKNYWNTGWNSSTWPGPEHCPNLATGVPPPPPPAQNGSCNNSVALGCNIGSAINDNGQVACGTTRTWNCSGVNGGSNSAQCSRSNGACACSSIPSSNQSIACSAVAGSYGIPVTHTVGTAFYRTETAACMPNNGQVIWTNISGCSAPVPQSGVCNNTVSLGCSIGSAINDNGQVACGTTRTWNCSGVNGGSNSAQCSRSNGACACSSIPSSNQSIACSAVAGSYGIPVTHTVGTAFYRTETAACMPNNGQVIWTNISGCSAPSYTWKAIQCLCRPNATPSLGNNWTGYEDYVGKPCPTLNQTILAGAWDWCASCPIGQRGIATLRCEP